MNLVKKYRYVILFAVGLGGLLISLPEVGKRALAISFQDATFILGVLPAVLILVALFDVWIPKETVIRYMGKNAGVRGLLLTFLLGAVSAGPLFVAFPIAAMLAKKGARLANILFFLGIWTSAKLPMVLFEWSFFGAYFTAVHVLVGVLMFLGGAFLIERLAPADSLQRLETMAETNS